MTRQLQPDFAFRPLIFGEVLFDCFPESRVLGGAPFNVAWNLRGFGINPLVLTAVGNDPLGREVLDRVAQRKLDSSGIRVHDQWPTGRVDIQTKNGEPTYTFWDDVAYDHITFDPQIIAEAQPALLYHGSLALRGLTSLESLQSLKRTVACPVFVDINLRLPHYDFRLTETILSNCEHLKLNHDELILLTGSKSELPSDFDQRWQLRRELAQQLQRQYNIGQVWITAAEEGAGWLGANAEFLYIPAPHVSNLVDTVGAGDALTAVIIFGLLAGRQPAQILPDAVRFAARVCQIRGAITDDDSFYDF